MSAETPAALLNFAVFNSNYGTKEGEEHKKVLYFYPPDTDMDTQIKHVGLSEAIAKFTETFLPDEPCESLYTQKSRQVFFQPEPNFWMVMTVSVPYIKKTKDEQEYFEYQPDDLQDNILLAILKQAYQMFRLFMDTFTSIVERTVDVVYLKQRLEHFFSRYLLTINPCHADVLDVFQGIHFLPLDKQTFLRVQCFINVFEASFPQVKYTAFLYNDQLVWSGLDHSSMQVMYRYLVTSLFPAYLEKELQVTPGGSSRNSGSSFSYPHYGKFVTGPPDIQDSSNSGKVPRVFITSDNGPEDCRLIVYRALSATVCLLIHTSFQLTFDFYKNLDNFLGPQLSSLASDVNEQYNKKSINSSPDPHFQFIYFNHHNLAQKSTIHLDNRRTGNISVQTEALKLLADINADFTRIGNSGEIVLKTMSDCWVVGRLSDRREFYVVINQRDAILTEINEEVQKLCAAHFSNIFFLE